MRKQLHREPRDEKARDARKAREESTQSVGSPSMMEYYPTSSPHVARQCLKQERWDVLVTEGDNDAEYTPLWNPLHDVGEQAESN